MSARPPPRLTGMPLIATQFVSLNGVAEAPGGEAGHPHSGWTVPWSGERHLEFKLAETLQAQALLLGRRTYEGFAEAWPARETMDGPIGTFARKYGDVPKHVVSSTLAEPLAWRNASVLPGPVATSVARLREHVAGELQVHGSGQLVRELLRLGLVDELRLMVFPTVIARGGAPLPDDVDARLDFDLAGVRELDPGVVLLTYRPIAEATT